MSQVAKNNNKEELLQVVVYCGPNGSGKTTMMDGLKEKGLPGLGIKPPKDEVNPDRVAQSLTSIPEGKEREEAAQQRAWEMRNEFLAERKPFSFETVMSHPSRISELQRLKEADYTIYLTFVTTNNPQKNVDRVARRVALGLTTGHDVPTNKVLSRYKRTLELLPKAVELADVSWIYDNSYDGDAATVQAIITNGKIERIEQSQREPWVHEHLIQPLFERQKELNALERHATERGYELEYPNELVGQYSGKIAFQTANFLVVYGSGKKLTVHDKLMLDSMSKQRYVIDTPCTVTYDYKTAPTIDLNHAV